MGKQLDITVTVGSNGDYQKISDALTYLRTLMHKNIRATIKLLSGFVVSEQVVVDNDNFGWVRIEGEDDYTTGTHTFGAHQPLFLATNNSVFPVIAQSFYINSGTNGVIMNVTGNSSARIEEGITLKNTGNLSIGINVLQNSFLYARNITVEVSTFPIRAYSASSVYAENCTLSHTYTGSTWNAIEIYDGSLYNMMYSVIDNRSSAPDLFLERGAQVIAVGTTLTKPLPQAANTVTANGIIYR
ncbi:MAG: hypothetical protein LBJ88_03915 [Campylobacteraceae bacterium]|jgi:hypothetical protein|nr:hypothetical protein [Campylobacteraceae bacterium]